MDDLTRRQFLKLGAGTCLAVGTSTIQGCSGEADNKGRRANSQGARVHVLPGDNLAALYRMGGHAAQALGINAGRKLSGTRVFIKPNLFYMGSIPLIPFRPESGEFTKAEVIIGVAEQCLMAGADKVTIGDAAQGMDWNWKGIGFFPGNTIFGTTNIHDAVESLRAAFPNQEIELSCLNSVNQWVSIPSSSDDDVMQDGLKVARSFCEADHVISVPVIKNHFQADLSCSMKNFVGAVTSMPPFGTTVVRDKLHMAYANAESAGFEKVGIAGCFMDICKWRKEAGKEDFVVVDCSIGVEATGPIAAQGLGKTIDLKERCPLGKYFLLASKDLVAADAIAARLTNRVVNNVKHLLMAEELNLGAIDNVTLSGATLEQIRVDDWEPLSFKLPEWGVSSTIPDTIGGSALQRDSRFTNTLVGLSLPAFAICFLRRYHRKNGTPQENT